LPWAFRRVALTNSRELFFLLVATTTLLFGIGAENAGLSMSLGAFLAGVLISESPYHQQALAELSPLRDLFLGFFFASIGMMLNHEILSSEWRTLLWLIPLLFSLKAFIIYLLGRFNKQSHGISILVAFGLTQIGEFSLVLGSSAKLAGILDGRLFQLFLFCAVFSLLMTPAFYTIGFKIMKTLRKPKANTESTAPDSLDVAIPERRALVIGLGHAGRLIVQELHSENIPVVGVDFNINNVEQLTTRGWPAVYGDATRLDVLSSAGVRSAFLVVITVNSKVLAAQILDLVTRQNPDAQIVIRVQYRLDQKDLVITDHHQVIIAEDLAANEILKSVRQAYSL
jgi:CPA2 family monovalent cation:H+ antiporter-2